MTRYLIIVPDEGTRFVVAEKAIHKGNQIVFYGKDGRDIIAQMPDTITFFKDQDV